MPRNKGNPKFQARLPPDTADTVNQYIEERGISKSEAIRRAVQHSYEQGPPVLLESFAAALATFTITLAILTLSDMAAVAVTVAVAFACSAALARERKRRDVL
jgi:hypothetical protein